MDRIDVNLFDAWCRIGEKCRRDRMEALRRYRRRFGRTLNAPPRAACLCIRASDRRITTANAAFSFEQDTLLRPNEATDEAVERGERHIVTLRGDLIRKLTEPICIDLPGIEWKQGARMCGVTLSAMRRWIKAGTVVVVRRSRDYSYGVTVPIVYTPSPIDPNHVGAHPPHRIWGSLWQWQFQQLPEEFEQDVIRVPRIAQTRRGHQVGWDWICPGRVDVHGETIACGRRCRRLYGPMALPTLAGTSGVRWELAMPAASGLAGTWHPGEEEIGPRKGARTFACKQCWGVRSVSLVGTEGWGAFVAYMSGGLLYGHEVERPPDEAPHVRRIEPYVQRNAAHRPSPRRDEVMRGIVRGESRKDIAERMGVSPLTVKDHIRKIFRKHGVQSREELRAKIAAKPRCSVGM